MFSLSSARFLFMATSPRNLRAALRVGTTALAAGTSKISPTSKAAAVRTPLSPSYASGARQPFCSGLAANGGPQLLWVVMRQDDHGNAFTMSTHGTREDAEAVVRLFEERGHKQTYFVKQCDSKEVYPDTLSAPAAFHAPSGRLGAGSSLSSSFGARRAFSTTTASNAAASPATASDGLPAAAGAALSRSSSTAGFDPAFSAEDNEFIARQQVRDVPFALTPSFLAKYAQLKPPFGFNGLGEFVFTTRYARLRVDGTRETWAQTVERVVTGTYNMQRKWISGHILGWNPWRAQRSAQEMFDRIFHMKFLPPGRGLWAMGTPVTEERGLFAALNNCAFVSTADLASDPVRPFTFLMDASMLGVGVGFDTDGAGQITVKGVLSPSPSTAPYAPPHIIGDSREGWVESVKMLLQAHFDGLPRPAFDFTTIRPRGSPIRGFGGVASGPEVLQRLHADVDGILTPLAGQPITITAIVDLMNAIGRCIVSGDVRQTAEIAFGDPDSDEYIDLKDYDKNPGRAQWGWCSNNSVYARLGMPYDRIAQRIVKNGEPGLAWLDNMQRYGRMGDPPNDKDSKVKGGNPCLEQSLESYELCCLVEVFPNNHKDLDDFLATLKFAYLYAKTVTLGGTQWAASNRVMLRNRRIGTSLSGLAQFIAARGMGTLHDWCQQGYVAIQATDARLSDWLAIPRSVKTTCVKPSGTVSLLAGATPGVHSPEARFYYRRVRVGKDHPVVGPLKAAGYAVDPAVEDPDRKVVVTFPVDAGEGVRTLDQLSMWEQLGLAAFMQECWADNQVSCTVTFDPEREGHQIPHALDQFQYRLKGISFLPRAPTAVYAQLPYEAISEDQYRQATARLKPLDLQRIPATAPSASSSSASAAAGARSSTSSSSNCNGPASSISGGLLNSNTYSNSNRSSSSAFADHDPQHEHPAGPDRFCDSSQCDVDLYRPVANTRSALTTAAAAAVEAGPRDYCGSPCEIAPDGCSTVDASAGNTLPSNAGQGNSSSSGGGVNR